MKSLLALFLLLVTGIAFAAPPQKVSAVYEVTRNGQPFATVSETYKQEDGRYQIESLTKGIGVYALFGIRKFISVGEVTTEGLRPSRFEVHQGNKKPQVASFDWETHKLIMLGKKQTITDLESGAQDLASFPYQFMFHAPSGEQFSLAVSTGKKLGVYQYRIADTNESLDGVMGGIKTLRLTSVAKNEGDDEKELWLAKDKHHIPAKITFRDENGARIEQVLTSLSFE